MQGLNHPHIVRVLDGPQEENGAHYFVMDYLPAGDLYRAILHKKVERPGGLQAILQIGDALDYAHRRGLVHRDVKPQNILIDETGDARLADFDLVWAQDSTGGTRTTGMGTFLFAAPEEMEDASRVDERADVYSLAMTTVFVLYGRSLPRRVLDTRRSFIGSLDCNQATKDLLLQATAWEPSARPATAWAFCRALSDALLERSEDTPSAMPEARNTSVITPAYALGTPGVPRAIRYYMVVAGTLILNSVVITGIPLIPKSIRIDHKTEQKQINSVAALSISSRPLESNVLKPLGTDSVANGPRNGAGLGGTPSVSGIDTNKSSTRHRSACGDIITDQMACNAYKARNFTRAINIMESSTHNKKALRLLYYIRANTDIGELSELNPADALLYYTRAAELDIEIGGALAKYYQNKIMSMKNRIASDAWLKRAGDSQKDINAKAILDEATKISIKDPGKARQACRTVMQMYFNNPRNPMVKAAYTLLQSIPAGRNDDDDF